jgi:hypothetical protein
LRTSGDAGSWSRQRLLSLVAVAGSGTGSGGGLYSDEWWLWAPPMRTQTLAVCGGDGVSNS